MKHGIVLFGHGSRDPAWRRPMDEVAKAITTRDPQVSVICAFLELTEPGLPAAVAQLAAQGVQSVHVLPLFLGVGAHARNDLPKLVAQARSCRPDVRIDVGAAVGERPEVIALLAELALRPGPSY